MKSELLEIIRVELRSQLDRLCKAASEAHAAATDPGSKAEGKYDTRSLEASYLAAGQARQVDELAESLRILDALVLPDFDLNDLIEAGALVEVSIAGEMAFFLMVPTAGGMTVSCDGCETTLLTPESRLYQNLLGLQSGDELESPRLKIISVR